MSATLPSSKAIPTREKRLRMRRVAAVSDTIDPRSASRRMTLGWLVTFVVLVLTCMVHAGQCAPSITTMMSPAALVHATADLPWTASAEVSDGESAVGPPEAFGGGTIAQGDPDGGSSPDTQRAIAACLLLMVVMGALIATSDPGLRLPASQRGSTPRGPMPRKVGGGTGAPVVLRT